MDSSVARRNFLIYSALSTVLTGVSISNVIHHKPNFYSLLILLSHGIHILVLSNFFIVVLILLGKVLQMLLFGELRLIEREHVYERSWLNLMNLLMAIAIFRDVNNLLMGILVLSLLFLKIFHWILVDRIQYVFQTQTSIKGIVFQRTTLTLFLFLAFDYWMVKGCIESSFSGTPDLYVIFGFDFALLFFDLFEEFGKSVLNISEIWYLNNHEDEDVWEFKAILLKTFEISLSVVKLLAILFNVFILIGPLRMPVTVMRESYVTVSNLIGQISDLIRYRRASRELDKKLLNATLADFERDDTCIICRDEMSVDVPKSTRLYPKKLNCGHVIHLGCLKSWMERSESCPLCRSPVFSLDGNGNIVNANNDEQQQEQNEQEEREERNQEIVEEPAPRPRWRRAIDTVFRGNREANNEPVNSSTESVAEEIYHAEVNEPTITLPSNSIILPPDWFIFPLDLSRSQSTGSVNGQVYDVTLNPTTVGTVMMRYPAREETNYFPTPDHDDEA